MQKAGKRLPVTVQVTLEAAGTMLLGTEIGAALTALEPFDVDVIGLNCATGPQEMNDAVRFLGINSTKVISILPNAGLPQDEGGHRRTARGLPNWPSITSVSLPSMVCASSADVSIRQNI